MKMWIKYLAGILIGIISAFILPENIISVAFEAAIRFGRYTVLPLLFFGASVAFYKLKTSKMLLKTTAWTLLAIVGSTVILTLLGLISVLCAYDLTLPIIEEAQETSIIVPELLYEMARSLLPFSIFEDFTLIETGCFLLPIFVFAGFAGTGCAIDTTASKPVFSFLESAAKVCYSIMCNFAEWFSVAFIAIAGSWTVKLFSIDNFNSFKSLILLLFIDFALVIGVIYPLILRFLCKNHHPYHVLYAAICPILTGFFSTDSNLTMLVNLRHSRESIGEHQQASDFSVPLFSIFARGGTALITVIGFVVILRSHTRMDLTFATIFQVVSFAFITSFVLGTIPSGGVLITIATLCSFYGRGYENQYLLISPVALILCSFATAIDAATAIFGSYIIGLKTKMMEHVEVKRYI